jgi:hypothetical protein
MSNLVVIRCGDQSLHTEWVNQFSNFDVVISYFGDSFNYDLTYIRFVHYYKGSKWQGLYNFFLEHKEIWEAYDYIWLPDDDLSTTSINVNDFFKIMSIYKFSLAQPALTHNSYFSHDILLQVKSFIYRDTNFVEVMAPCFNIVSLSMCWQTFGENKSGWGLDVLWSKKIKDEKIGIIDETPIFHTRPVGIAGHGMGNEKNSPFHEYEQLCKKYHLKMRNGCYGGLLQSGKYIKNKKELINFVVAGCSRVRVKDCNSFNRLYNEVMHPNRFLGR